MNDGMERARDRRNILEQLGAKIPGFRGYLEREMRREVDKLQRDWLAAQVDRARFAMNSKIRDWTRSVNPLDDTADFLAISNVNINQACNATFSGNAVNFYRAAGGCVNTAFSTV